jgi:hypothetical protein
MRAVVSTPPPGENGTTNRTGRVGYWDSAACAAPAAMHKPSTAMALMMQLEWMRVLMLVSSV